VQQVDTIPTAKLEQITTKVFYQQYLTNNLPLLVEDGCKDWPALKKWGDLDYIGD
jgi:hypothetical protein